MSYIINPKSGRTIRVGSKTWKQLVSDQLIEGDITPIYESTDKEELKVAKKILKRQSLGPRKMHIIAGNKIIEVNKRITSSEMTNHAVKSAGAVFKKIRTGEIDIPEEMDDDQLAKYLEKCVMAECVGGEHKIEKPKPKRKRAPNKPKFQVQTPLPTDAETTEQETTAFEDSSSDESEEELP